jgi:4-diphosphocytidyl-2-C-methyl-D-erythritol kinase
MTALRDIARAKINLTLEVLGRRADGFHEVRSLVAFATLGDELELTPGDSLELEIEGPFAAALGGGNLVLDAAKAARQKAPGLKLGRFRLNKMLPVAAGLGGGSADAASALRLIARINPELPETVPAELAPKLGSDVRVCLASVPALITGRGEKVEAAGGFPACGVVLVNPGRSLSTQTVYAASCAKPLQMAQHTAETLDFGGDLGALLAYARPRGNDLEAPATTLVPEIVDVLQALSACRGVRLARLSGSGPTCFGLFATEDEAKACAARLAAEQSAWWIAAGLLWT